MKPNPKAAFLLLSLSASLALAACGTRYVSRDISPQGIAGEVIFPSADSATLKNGTFPNPADVRLIAPGMTKDQLSHLLGHPHFREGYAGVREWDYLFHFRKDGKIVTCQYKAVFDENYLAQSFHWLPQSCADLLVEQAAIGLGPAAETRFDLSADALFAFGKYEADDILPKGREQLSVIAAKLKDADTASIAVVGHTDRIGSVAANQLLSERRAATVRGYLLQQGVTAAGIAVEGRGESEPVTECAEQPHEALVACLAPNRRVEIRATARPRN